MKLRKNDVIKDIPENLVSTYLAMGWEKYKEPVKEKKFEFKKNIETDNEGEKNKD